MSEELRRALAEITAQAVALDKAVGKLDGQLPGLIVAQATVTADKLRAALRRLAEKVHAAAPRQNR